jgi:hypothetical protein
MTVFHWSAICCHVFVPSVAVVVVNELAMVF